MMFVPKLFTTLKTYTRKQFGADVIAGIIVGIVALPLAIAFAIASGVSPEKGLFTAIVAGFLISALGGSKVQIGGPTGAFIVIVYGIVQQYGVAGLTIATLMAGFMLILMGLSRLGAIIKFIPHPLIVGFTSGIALIIFSSQLKDFLGLQIASLPADFIGKWVSCFAYIHTANVYAFGIGLATILIIAIFPRISSKIPGSLAAIIVCTLAVTLFQLPVDTIGSRFGNIPSTLPAPHIASVDFATIQHMIKPAFTIALLGAIESLLSAVVADGMIGGNHRSNMELVAQGTANIFSSIFGGIPATGAIARTATNIKNGGRTPIAGIVHALTLLVIMLFAGRWAKYIPMSCLAGILVIVAYNMSEWRSFVALSKGPKEDVIILITTFLLTVLVDLTVAIEIGIVLAAFLFVRKIALMSKVDLITRDLVSDDDQDDESDNKAISRYKVPKGVEVFEIKGPFFFGAAYKFKESMEFIENTPEVFIIRMRSVPIIDATGIHALERVIRESQAAKTKLIISGLQPSVYKELEKSGILHEVGLENIKPDIDEALKRAGELLNSADKS